MADEQNKLLQDILKDRQLPNENTTLNDAEQSRVTNNNNNINSISSNWHNNSSTNNNLMNRLNSPLINNESLYSKEEEDIPTIIKFSLIIYSKRFTVLYYLFSMIFDFIFAILIIIFWAIVDDFCSNNLTFWSFYMSIILLITFGFNLSHLIYCFCNDFKMSENYRLFYNIKNFILSCFYLTVFINLMFSYFNSNKNLCSDLGRTVFTFLIVNLVIGFIFCICCIIGCLYFCCKFGLNSSLQRFLRTE